mmetsp:Transcript_5321/g.7070  ORF Transcript_5321/g.7070 Transcript_5321/m.7070 type:complete len:109 (-) Transcript_5321:194-520(-)
MGSGNQYHDDINVEDFHPRCSSSTDDDETMDQEYVERKMRSFQNRANEDGQHPHSQDDIFGDFSEELRKVSKEGYERHSSDNDSDFVRKRDFFARHRGIYDDDDNDVG